MLLLLSACGFNPGVPADSSQDVRGLYALTWSDQFTVRLDIGGAVQEQTVSGDEIVTFDGPDGAPLELDLGTFCTTDGVDCPSEVWPGGVAVDQDSPELDADVHVIHVSSLDNPSDRRDGLVDHAEGRFLVGLDGASGGDGSCGALALSAAGGRFTYEGTGTSSGPAGRPIGMDEGQVAVGWLGVCAWEGFAVAATLSVETTFVGERTGDLPTPSSGDSGDTAAAP
jgi:hypothetical protein